MTISKTIIEKQPSEVRRLSMDFSNKMADDELITAVVSVVSSPVGVISADLSYSGQMAQALLSEGVVPDRPDVDVQEYIMTWKVTTDAGQELENDGKLLVREDGKIA